MTGEELIRTRFGVIFLSSPVFRDDTEMARPELLRRIVEPSLRRKAAEYAGALEPDSIEAELVTDMFNPNYVRLIGTGCALLTAEQHERALSEARETIEGSVGGFE